MHRQHAALFAVRSIAVSVLRPADRRASTRSPWDASCRTASPLLVLLLICSGCYGPYQAPVGGYGSPYGFPPAGMPTQTLQPGGTYVPTPYGQPVTPSGTFQQPTTTYPPIDQTGGSSPFYGSGSSSQPYDGGGVPTYNDPNEVQFKQPVQPDNTAIDSHGAVEGASAEFAGVAKVDLNNANFIVDESNSVINNPQGHDAAAQSPAAPAAIAHVSDQLGTPGQFEPAPTEAAPAGAFQVPRAEPNFDIEAAPAPMPFPGEAAPLANPVAASMPPTSTFAHDESFTWLRGVLRFDAASGAWMMIYSDNPSPGDEHGGKLLVADAPLLEQFKPQAVVLLRGGIDETQSAAAGRAVFRAEVIEPFEPSGP